jgi:hypothetical protein
LLTAITLAFLDISAAILPCAKSKGYVIAVVNRAVPEEAPTLAIKVPSCFRF